MNEITVEQAFQDLFEDNVISEDSDNHDKLAAITIFGLFLHGADKEKVRTWVFSRGDGTPHQNKHFDEYWDNLIKNGVVREDKVYVTTLPEEEGFGVEFALLISVALGYVERCE